MSSIADISSSKRQRTLNDSSSYNDNQPADQIHVLPLVQTLILSADQGDVESAFMLCENYLEGRVSLPREKAFGYLHMAAGKMYLPALNLLRRCYTEGIGMQQDDTSAFYYSSLSSILTNNVHVLDLSTNPKFRKTGCREVAEALKVNTSLISLYFKNHGTKKCIEGAEIMYETLKINTTLQKLVFCSNSISNAGGIAFSEILSINHSLTYLDLSRNRISSDGIKAIANCLSLNQSLRVLNLNRNLIYDSAAIALSNALEVNTTLKELSLNNEIITPFGCNRLFIALAHNSALTSLDLSNNSNNYYFDSIITMLSVNTTLVSLNLQNSTICNFDLIRGVGNALQINSSLTELNIMDKSWNLPYLRYTIEALEETRLPLSLKDNYSLRNFKWNFDRTHLSGENVMARRIQFNKEISTYIYRNFSQYQNTYVSLFELIWNVWCKRICKEY